MRKHGGYGPFGRIPSIYENWKSETYAILVHYYLAKLATGIAEMLISVPYTVIMTVSLFFNTSMNNQCTEHSVDNFIEMEGSIMS